MFTEKERGNSSAIMVTNLDGLRLITSRQNPYFKILTFCAGHPIKSKNKIVFAYCQ